jgi:hypothetical protein
LPFSFFSLQTVWAFVMRFGTGAAADAAGVSGTFESEALADIIFVLLVQATSTELGKSYCLHKTHVNVKRPGSH